MIVIVKFVVCALMIFYAGRKVAKYGDIIAEKTGLGGLWIGMALISVTTSLPEIFTGVGSSLFLEKPDISLGNIFGANSYNILNIVLLDALYKNGPLLSSVSSGLPVVAVLSMLPLVIALSGLFFTSQNMTLNIYDISIWSVLIFATYLVCVKIIFEYESRTNALKKDEEKLSKKYENVTTKECIFGFILSSTVIAMAGIWLSYIADEISITFGLELSFVGSLFLGFATTLPEISVSVAAIMLGAKEMAVANMLGSNLFNVCIVALNDVLYRKGDIFSFVSPNVQVTALMVLILTVIVAAAMMVRPKKKYFGIFSAYSFLLVFVFVAGALLNFIMK